MIRAANGLARVLKAESVPWVSTFPTCGINNGLGEEGVPILMMRDERFAVAIADAFSRVTGGNRIGVCSVMGGLNPAGLQMAYGAISQAFEDSSPLLCLSDGLPVGAGDVSRYDITASFRPVTKWIGHIDQPQRVPEVLRQAFTYLRTGRPGPVLVTLPRFAGEYDETRHTYTPVKGWKWGPDPDDVNAAVKALLTAEKPLLYVGEGIYYGDATDELKQFVELAQVPVLTTLKAKSSFPENHPLSVGTRGELAIDYLRRCDLLFAIGSSLSAGRFSHVIPNAKHKVIVQCAVDEVDINRVYRTDHAVIGDAKLTLRALTDRLASLTGGGVPRKQGLVEEIRAAKDHFIARYRPWMESNEKPINPYRVYGDLMKVIDLHNSTVSPDSGNTRDQTSTIYEALMPRGFMGWGNISTLGFGLAAAVGAKLAFPKRQCVNITGDGGVSYMIGNFEALVRYGIGVTTIHINNGGFAGYAEGPWGPGHDPYTCEVSDHTVADLSAAVKAMGYYAEDVTEPSEIIPALRRAFDENARNRPAYLEVLCAQHPVYGEFAAEGGLGH